MLKELRQTEYDLVVAGSWPAEDKLYKYVMGDVAREIVNRAEIPVLVVRTGQRQIGRLFKKLSSAIFQRLKEISDASKS